MKNALLYLLIYLTSQASFSQKLFNNKIEDTLSIEAFAKKVELENDIKESERLNDLLFEEVNRRKQLKNIPEYLKVYYENACLITLITKAYFDNLRGDFKKEIAVYFEILKHKNKKTDNRLLAYTYNGIGLSFAEIKDNKKAIYYCKLGLVYQKKVKNFTGISLGYDRLGQLYLKENQLDKALYYLQQSISYSKKSYNKSNISSTYSNIGDLHQKKKDYLNAIENYKKGIQISIDYKDDWQLSILYHNIADSYKKIGNNKEFEEYKLKSFQLAESSKNLTILQSGGECLYKIFKENKNFKKALFYYEKSNDAKNILEKEDNKNAILKAEFKLNTEIKENQIILLQKDKKTALANSEKQRNMMLVLGVLFISILFIIYTLFNRFKIKKHNEYLETKLLEAQKIIVAEKKAYKSELKAFKSQMNPHFFYNALNTVQSYILSNDKKLAISYLSKFSMLTRSILEMTEKEYISVSDEIKTLELYLDIEKARFNEDFEFTIKSKNINDVENIKIPTMFLQPFVENAIKHGLLHKEGIKKLEIIFSIEKGVLSISISDNGIGRKKSGELNAIKNKNHKSFATEAMQNRIDILNKTRSQLIKLEYIDKTNPFNQAAGTTVTLEIPL